MRTDRQGEAIQTRAQPLPQERLDDPDPTAGRLSLWFKNARAGTLFKNTIHTTGIEAGE